MITFLLILGLIISVGLNVACFILIRNQLNKISTYEAWILEFKQNVIDAQALIKAIDKQAIFATHVNEEGAFESDDHIGQLFKEIAQVIEKLNERTQ